MMRRSMNVSTLKGVSNMGTLLPAVHKALQWACSGWCSQPIATCLEMHRWQEEAPGMTAAAVQHSKPIDGVGPVIFLEILPPSTQSVSHTCIRSFQPFTVLPFTGMLRATRTLFAPNTNAGDPTRCGGGSSERPCTCRYTLDLLFAKKKARVTAASGAPTYESDGYKWIVHKGADGKWVCTECTHPIGWHPAGEAPVSDPSEFALRFAPLQEDSPPAPLLTGQLLNRASTKADLESAVGEVASHAAKPGLDKMDVPLITTVGTGGSGKTTVLFALRSGWDTSTPGSRIEWTSDLLKVIQKHTPKRKYVVKPKHLVVAMASMGQSTPYKESNEPIGTYAVTSRLLCDYLGLEFTSKHTKACGVSFRRLAEFFRSDASKKKGVLESEVAVLLLLDEVQKLEGFQRCETLNSLASFNQAQLGNGHLTFAYITSSEVSAFSSLVTSEFTSQRPVASVHMPPLDGGSGGGLPECVDFLMKQLPKQVPHDDVTRWRIEYAVAATGGHLHTLEQQVFRHDDWTKSVAFSSSNFIHSDVGPALLSLLRRLTYYPSTQFRESDTFEGCTLRYLASIHHVVYDKIYRKARCVTVRIPPCFLWAICSNPESSAVERDLVRGLLQLGEEPLAIERNWKVAIPMALELRGRLLQANERTIDDVLTKSKYNLHPGHSELSLFSNLDDDHKCTTVASDEVNVAKLVDDTSRPFGTPKFRVSKDPNERGLQLYIDIFAAKQKQRRKPVHVRLFWQMKRYKEKSVTAASIKGWEEEARKAAKKLGYVKGRDYIVLCVSVDETVSATLLGSLPAGVIIVHTGTCKALLEPLGLSPMLKQILSQAEEG